MSQDTSIDGAGRFPETCWSRILEAGSRPDLDSLIRSYWRPVYAYLRAKWSLSNDDAKDATQSFFAWMLDSRFLAKADPERGRFRGFVKTALRNFMIDEQRKDFAQKRGGLRPTVTIDDDAIGQLPAADGRTPEQVLDDVWRAELVENATRELEREFARRDRGVYFDVFRDYFLSDGELDYRAVAERYAISTTDVSNYLRKAKQRYRELLRASVLDTVFAEDSLREELEWLFGGAA